MPENEDRQRIIPSPNTSSSSSVFEFEQTGDPERCLTINELYNHAGYKLANFNTSVSAGLGLFVYGVMIVYTQLIGQHLKCLDQMTDIHIVAVKITPILGFLIGMPLCGTMSDRIGRTKTALVGGYVVLIGWLFSAVSVQLMFATVLAIGIGFAFLLPSVITYAFEKSSVYQHTRVGLLIFGEYIFGQIYGLVMFDMFVELVGWQWITVIMALPTLVFIIYFHIADESPKFLAISGRSNSAYEQMLVLHKANKVPMMLGRLSSEEIKERGRCCTPCDASNLRTTILLFALFSGFSFCYYSTSYGVFMSLLEEGVCSSYEIIDPLTCDTNKKSYLVTSLIALAPDLLALVFAMLLCEAIGQKTTMMILSVVACAVVLANSVCFQSAAITLMELGIVRGFTFGLLIIIFIYAVEAYTTNHRATAFCYLLSMYALGMSLAGSVTYELRQSPSVIFIVLGVVLFLATIPICLLEEHEKKDIDETIYEQQSLTS